jgi:hypothetical protein
MQSAGLRPPNAGEAKEDVVVHRAGEPGGGTVTVALEAELQPGDVVEVRLRAEVAVAEGH